jgi:hypothetical protein
MPRFELATVPIPTDPRQERLLEQQLTKAAAQGAELVATMPHAVTGRVLGIFRVSAPGSTPILDHREWETLFKDEERS